MARCESRSNRVSHARDTGGFGVLGAPRQPGGMPGPRISVVVVDGDATGEGGSADAGVGPPIHVVGHASVGPAAIELVERVRPDVVLLAYEPGCPIGTETLDALRSTPPRARIVLVDARRNGSARSDSDAPSDVVVTDAAFADVVAGIQRAAEAADGAAAGGGGVPAVRRHGSGPALTRREHEI